MTVHLLCATPLLPAIADRAQAEFNAVTMQERQLTTAETIAALAAHPTIVAVLVSSRIRFDADAIAMLPPHVRLIDTCSVGHEHIDLAAAGLDVFRAQPDYDLRLRDLPNVFLTPHMGTATVETRAAMGHRALDNVADFLRGSTPRDALWHGSS